MNNAVGKFLINNFGAILIVALIIVGYFGIKGYFQKQVERNAQIETLIRSLDQSKKIDSILSARNQIILDSLSKDKEMLLKEIKYIEKQNKIIDERSKKILDNYSSIAIDRPDF